MIKMKIKFRILLILLSLLFLFSTIIYAQPNDINLSKKDAIQITESFIKNAPFN